MVLGTAGGSPADPRPDAGLGRRRSWLVLSQAMIVCGLVGMAPTTENALMPSVGFSRVLTAFGLATQDIALDAYRIESGDDDHGGAPPRRTRRATASR